MNALLPSQGIHRPLDRTYCYALRAVCLARPALAEVVRAMRESGLNDTAILRALGGVMDVTEMVNEQRIVNKLRKK